MGVVQDGSTYSLLFFSKFHQAKEMVAIADKVASKLEEKKGSITEDEVNNYSYAVNAQFLHQRINQLGHLIQLWYVVANTILLVKIFGMVPSQEECLLGMGDQGSFPEQCLVIETTFHRDNTV